MESNQKLRGLKNKSKVVMSCNKTPKFAFSTTNLQVQPNSVNQTELAAVLLPLPKQQKVSFVNSAGSDATTLEETVNTRASSYISHVREQFRLERIEADRQAYQDMCY